MSGSAGEPQGGAGNRTVVDRDCAGPGTLGVPEALAVASGAIRSVAPGLLWVQGEVEGLTRSRAGHWYSSLSGDGARLPVCALGRDAAAIARTLSAAQVTLADGVTVRVRGSLGVYSPRGQLQLRASAIDPAVSVGVAALARREVRARLAATDLAGRQATLSPVLCPLRVSVVAPPGRGLEDLVAVLAASPWAWTVTVAALPSEGETAPAAIAAAADLIVVTRGGGAGVTTAYDTFEVASAVCALAVPVVVAIGHSADASVSDEMAWRSVATPTAANELCVELLEHAERTLLEATRDVVACGRACLDHDEAELAAVEAAVAARAATVTGKAAALAVARSKRTALLALVAAVILAIAVILLIWIR